MNSVPKSPDAADPVPPQLAAAVETGKRFLAPGGNALDWAHIDANLAMANTAVERLRDVLQGVNGALANRFLAGALATDLIADQTALVDRVIRTVWERTCGPELPDAVLAAVGGYGRGELHPYSDVDLLVLLPDQKKRDVREPVSAFLALLWDIGLQVGHSTRTVGECRDESRRDLTTATTLMEARWLLGPEELFRRMEEACAPPDVWPARAFFEAKLKEQHARHGRYDDTAYNLEPNIKGSPGGLRDIQMIVWVARRHFGTGDLEALVAHKFMAPAQLRVLRQGRDFLWRVRFALHVLTGRKEDRLLFDYQARIAKLFGYQDATYMLAVEQLMQRYYRTVMDLSRLNEMLLQLFQEAILMNPDVEPEPLNERFQVKNGFLQIIGRFCLRAAALRDPGAVPPASAESAVEGRERDDDRHSPAQPVSDRRRVPPGSAQPPPVPADPARPGRRDPRVATHEPLRRARTLCATVRAHRRAHAIRPLPRLHG